MNKVCKITVDVLWKSNYYGYMQNSIITQFETRAILALVVFDYASQINPSA